MERFDFVRLPAGKGSSNCPEVYVCAASMGYCYEKPDPRAGHFLLTNELTTEAECNKAIDDLISELNRLKTTAARWFKKQEGLPIMVPGFNLDASRND